MVVRFEFLNATRAEQALDHIAVSHAEIAGLMTCFQPVGFWRSDLDSGHVYWSADIFEIFGMDFTDGPVNVADAYSRLHPQDASYTLELVERAAREKTSFHLVLRLKNGANAWKFIRCVGRYRVTNEGREEIYGMIEQFLDQIPMIGLHDISKVG